MKLSCPSLRAPTTKRSNSERRGMSLSCRSPQPQFSGMVSSSNRYVDALSRNIVSRNITTDGRTSSETRRRPPIVPGFTTASAPARHTGLDFFHHDPDGRVQHSDAECRDERVAIIGKRDHNTRGPFDACRSQYGLVVGHALQDRFLVAFPKCLDALRVRIDHNEVPLGVSEFFDDSHPGLPSAANNEMIFQPCDLTFHASLPEILVQVPFDDECGHHRNRIQHHTHTRQDQEQRVGTQDRAGRGVDDFAVTHGRDRDDRPGRMFTDSGSCTLSRPAGIRSAGGQFQSGSGVSCS